jgi:hypothetical protein
LLSQYGMSHIFGPRTKCGRYGGRETRPWQGSCRRARLEDAGSPDILERSPRTAWASCLGALEIRET